jgi:tol-pal system protein YbgF
VRRAAVIFCLMLALPAGLAGLAATPVPAQQDRTLADLRQDLTALGVELQRLRRELSTTGGPGTALGGTNALDRIEAVESELQRLTAMAEALEYRIDRIVADGTNRLGDLEFRLRELEGGDISQIPPTAPLGGATESIATVPTGPSEAQSGAAGQGELAVGEGADYQSALAALDDGDAQRAADLLARFNETYPGSPLAAEADLARGRALAQLGDTREAARAYLASFTGNPRGPVAASALFELGAALGRLGQVQQACITLGEVGARFPTAGEVGQAEREMSALGCS